MGPAAVVQALLGADLTDVHADQLSSLDVSSIGEALAEYYETWSPPPLKDGELRFSLSRMDELDRSLLYSDSTVVPDPVFEWLTNTLNLSLGTTAQSVDTADRAYPDGVREALVENLKSLLAWDPLVRSGVVIPVPRRPERLYEVANRLRSPDRGPAASVDLSYSDGLVDHFDDLSPTDKAVLRAVKAREEASVEAASDEQLAAELWRVAGVPDDEIVPEILGYVDSFNQGTAGLARPVACHPVEWAYLLFRLRDVQRGLRHQRLELQVVPALATATLPLLRDVPPKVLMSIREDESAFHEWRLLLRRAIRDIEADPGSSDFAANAQEVFEEVLTPFAATVLRTTSRSSVLREAARGSTLRFGIGAAFAAASAGAGVPVSYSAAAAALGALSDVTARAFLGPSLSGSQAVILQLARR